MHSTSIRRFLAAFALLTFTFSIPAQAKDDFRDENLSKLKKHGVKQVVVPYFKVNVHTKLNKTAKAKSGLFGGGNASAKASMFTEWTDPDTKMLQQVADSAWQAFEKQLTAAGFEVVPLSKVTATEAFKKINAGTEPVKSDNMLSLAPTGMKVYDPMGKIDPNGSFFLGVGNMNSKLEGDIAREVLGTLDGVAVVRITLNLAYGAFETEVDSYTAMGSSDRDSASAKVAFIPAISIKPSSPTVTPEITGIEFQTNFDTGKLPNGTEFNMPKDFTRVQLTTPLVGDKKVSALEEVTTSGEKAATGAVALFGAMMGQGASLEAGKYVAKVDGKAFTAESKKEIGKLAELIGQKVAVK
ncbi:hypothetical protein [Sideroxyarcus sp. TK5]